MIPTLSLGPWDAPSFEVLPEDMNPIVALLIEQFSTADQDNNLFQFLTLDTISLRDGSEEFFLRFENICKRIVSNEFAQYSVAKIQMSEYASYFKGGVGDGVISNGVKVAAQRFLDFLANHPDYWPLRSHEP